MNKPDLACDSNEPISDTYYEEDPIIETYYEYELNGVWVRKSWRGRASKVPRAVEIDEKFEAGTTITLKVGWI